MKSTGIISLFSEQPAPRKTPSAFFVSFLVHGVGFAWLIAGLKHLPQVNDRLAEERYTVRILETPKLEEAQSTSIDLGAQSAVQSIAHDSGPGEGGELAAPPSLPVQEMHLPERSQILIQPEAPPDRLIPLETPLPFTVMWAPETSPSKVIVAPPQQEPTVVKTQPAMIKPNREAELADVNIATTPFPAKLPLFEAGATSPLVVRGPEPIQQAPTTSSAQPQQPTPARIISISPLQSAGQVIIPLANQMSSDNQARLVDSPRSGNGAGSGTQAGKRVGPSGGDGAGDKKSEAGGSSNGTDGASQTSTRSVAQGGAETASPVGTGDGVPANTVHVVLPKDGQYGVVVVGSSLVEQYPEIAGIWSGRLVYTVYLHVGASKNWILQYSIPPAIDAAAAGGNSRPEAPWPYDILRPHLAADDYNSDAIMVHGFINLAGKFEKLKLVFPEGFAQAKFVLDALERWQFRPARLNGQIAAVEVLLIIPDESAQ
jgi:hypothetical protein